MHCWTYTGCPGETPETAPAPISTQQLDEPRLFGPNVEHTILLPVWAYGLSEV